MRRSVDVKRKKGHENCGVGATRDGCYRHSCASSTTLVMVARTTVLAADIAIIVPPTRRQQQVTEECSWSETVSSLEFLPSQEEGTYFGSAATWESSQ